MVITEKFSIVHGMRYLERVYADGCGELVRFDEETEMWAVLVFPATVEEGVEDRIRSVIRNNFDVGVCLKNTYNEQKAA